MSGLPTFRPRRFGAPDSLAAAIARGAAPAAELLPVLERPVRHEPSGRPARLEGSAFGCPSDAVRGKLERILAGEGALVTTGQQPLLFLGPMFVVYKALTAIELARRLEAETGRPTLAVFWIASDDHDWAEVGRTHVLDPSNELRTLELPPPPGFEARPTSAAPLDDVVLGLLDEMDQHLPKSEFKTHYLMLLRRSYEPGRRLADGFAETLSGVLDGAELAWLDAASPELKRASSELFARAVCEATELESALERGAEAVRVAGHEAPIPVLTGAAPLFFDTGERRQRVYVDGEGVRAGREGEPETLEAFLARLEREPERASPNVALRPALESWLLPVAASVLGPGELGYWSQLPPLFDALEVSLPSVFPRGSWTLVESKIRRTLEQLGAEPDDLEDGGEGAIARLTAESRPPAVDGSLHDLRSELAARLAELERAIGEELPGLRSAAGKAKKLLYDALGELGGQVDAAVRERERTQVEKVHKCVTHLFPDGKPQERVVSPFYYLSRYGPALIEHLAERTGDSLDETLGPAA